MTPDATRFACAVLIVASVAVEVACLAMKLPPPMHWLCLAGLVIGIGKASTIPS